MAIAATVPALLATCFFPFSDGFVPAIRPLWFPTQNVHWDPKASCHDIGIKHTEFQFGRDASPKSTSPSSSFLLAKKKEGDAALEDEAAAALEEAMKALSLVEDLDKDAKFASVEEMLLSSSSPTDDQNDDGLIDVDRVLGDGVGEVMERLAQGEISSSEFESELAELKLEELEIEQKLREANLKRREAELKRREVELKRREAEVRSDTLSAVVSTTVLGVLGSATSAVGSVLGSTISAIGVNLSKHHGESAVGKVPKKSSEVVVMLEDQDISVKALDQLTQNEIQISADKSVNNTVAFLEDKMNEAQQEAKKGKAEAKEGKFETEANKME